MRENGLLHEIAYRLINVQSVNFQTCIRNNLSCLLQNGRAFIFLREIITFGAQSFHLAVEIQSMIQTMQVCLINTRTVCVEKKVPLGECDYKNSQLDTPTTGQKWTNRWIHG